MASNLPPGVTDRMIPGNSPENQEAEARADHLFARVVEVIGQHESAQMSSRPLSENAALCESLTELLDETWLEGHARGCQSAREDTTLVDDELGVMRWRCAVSVKCDEEEFCILDVQAGREYLVITHLPLWQNSDLHLVSASVLRIWLEDLPARGRPLWIAEVRRPRASE